MSATGDEFQVVFVIDVKGRHEKGAGECRTDNTIKSIQLAVLKLLTYFTNKNTRSVLKWGVKYYNFCGKSEQIRKYGFKDFSGKTYEEFEAEVERLLHSERLKLENRVKSPHKNKLKQMQTLIDEDSIYNDINLIGDADDEKHPSMKIREALQQAANEFHWDRPLSVLGSPVRGKRSQHAVTVADNIRGLTGNHIFLFAACPQSSSDLCRFTECYRDDFQPHRNAFITRNLERDLQLSRKIDVHWINIVDNPVKTKDFHGIETVDRIFCELGGGVLPIETVLQLNTSVGHVLLPFSIQRQHSSEFLEYSDDGATSSCRSEDKRSCFSLPFSSVLDHYLTKRKGDTDKSQQQKSKAYTLLCNQSDGNADVVCALCLQPMFSPVNHRLTDNADNNAAKKFVVRMPSEVELKIQSVDSETPEVCSMITVNTADTAVSADMVQDQDRVVSEVVPAGFKCNTYQICGTIETGSLPLDWFDCDRVYCCTGNTFDTRRGIVLDEASETFQALLMELFKQKLNLVLEDGSRGVFPSKIMLQPLTPLSATLTTIRPAMVLQLEKLLSLPRPDNTAQSAGLQHFVTKSVKHIQSILRPAVPQSVSTLAQEEAMSHQSDHYVFHCGTLEQWHLAGNHSKVNDFVQGFRTSSFGKRYSTELQKKLAKYYQKADQPKTMKGPMELEEMYSTAKQNNVVGDGKNQKKQLERLASSIKTTRGKHLVDTINHIKTNQKKGESESNSSVIDEGEIRQKKLEAKVKERRDRIQANVAKHDFTEERDLLESLHANYTQCISGNISPISCAQSLVNVMVHFSKSFYPDKYSEKSRGLLTDHFLKSYKSLRDNPMSENGENETMKIAEYQLQVLMRIELESALHDGEEEVEDAWVEEVANMLRRAAFSSDPTFLPQFLKEVVLENYVYVLPKTVGRIYEELMTEPPEEYAYLFSCENSDKDDSMNQSNPSIAEPPAPMSLRSASSIGSCSNDPWSNKSGSRSRSLVSHSSFTDASLKRQIMIPQVKKPKVEKAKVRGARPVTRSSAKKRSARKKKIIGPQMEVTKVKRNLFLGGDVAGQTFKAKTNRLERRHTMAAIPTNASHTPKKHSTPRKQTPVKTPRKTPNKMNTPKKVSPRHARHSRKARSRHCSGHIVKEHHILKTKMVSETPRHKQVAMALRKQERQQSETLQDVVVVEESPEKDLLVKSADLNASSLLNGSQKVKCKVQGKSILARRGSFYSEASRTLQKHRELAKRIAGHQPVIPLHPEMKLKLKTPVRKRGDFLLSQIRKSSEKKIENAGESQGLKKSTPDKTGNCTQVTNSTTAVTPRRATKKALFLSPVRTPTRTKTPTPRSSTQEETSCHTSLTPRKTPKKTGTPSSVKRAVFNKLATTPVKTYQETPVSCSTKVSNVCISETPSKLTNPDFVSLAKQTEFERLTWVSTTPLKAGSGISLEQSSFADTPSKNTRSRTEVGQYDELGDKNGASGCQGLSDIHNKERNALTEAVKPAKLKVERECATDSEQLTELDTTNQSKTSKVHRKQSERLAASNSTKSRKKLDSSSGVESENDTTPMKGQLSIKTFLQHTPPQETLLSSASPFTPPPIRVQTTPDTFDKWHRRKSRHGLHSPAAVKTKAASSIFNTQPCQAKETGSKRQKSRRSISNGPSPSHANLGNYGEGNVIAKDDDSETAEKGCKDNSMLSQNQNENSSLSFHDYMVFLSPSHRKTRKAAQEGKMSDDESVIHFKAAEDQGYSLFDPESAIQYNINVAKQVLKSSNEISEGTTIEKEVCRKDIQEAEEDSLLSNKEFAEKRRVLKRHSRSFDSQTSKESFNTQGWLPERVSRGHVKDTVVEPHQTKRSPPVLAGDICRDVSSDDSLKENKVLSRKRTWTSPNEMRTSKRLRTNTQSSHFDTEDSSDSISMESGDEFLNENETNSTFSYSSHKRAVMVQNTTNSDLLLDGVEAVGSPVHQRIYSLRKGRLRSFSSDVCHIVSGSSHHCDQLNSNVENSISKPYIQSSKGKSVSDVADLQTASPQGSEKQSSPKYSPVSAIGLLGLMNSPIINTSNVGAKLEVNKVGESEQRPRSRRTLNMKSANN